MMLIFSSYTAATDISRVKFKEGAKNPCFEPEGGIFLFFFLNSIRKVKLKEVESIHVPCLLCRIAPQHAQYVPN